MIDENSQTRHTTLIHDFLAYAFLSSQDGLVSRLYDFSWQFKETTLTLALCLTAGTDYVTGRHSLNYAAVDMVRVGIYKVGQGVLFALHHVLAICRAHPLILPTRRQCADRSLEQSRTRYRRFVSC